MADVAAVRCVCAVRCVSVRDLRSAAPPCAACGIAVADATVRSRGDQPCHFPVVRGIREYRVSEDFLRGIVMICVDAPDMTISTHSCAPHIGLERR